MNWLYPLLNDPSITDICINGSDEVFIDRGEGLESLNRSADEIDREDPKKKMRETDLRDWVLNELSQIGKSWDAKHPFVDGTLKTGHRIHVVFPPLARSGILVSLRRLCHRAVHAEGQIRWQKSPLYPILVEAVRQGDSMLISGATGSGKTTLATDLLGEVPRTERIIALEDTPELSPNHPHFLSLISRPPNADGFGEVTLRTLLKQTLRMRPDRIVLGECRGAEVLELLQALNTGHRGALATLHANSPRDALRRIELLCLLASEGTIPVSIIRELVSLGIEWLVQVRRENSSRVISECWKIEGREGDTILLRQVLQ